MAHIKKTSVILAHSNISGIGLMMATKQ